MQGQRKFTYGCVIGYVLKEKRALPHPVHLSLCRYLVDISILMLKSHTQNSDELVQCPSYNFWLKVIINLIHLIEAIYLVVLTNRDKTF